MSQLSFLRIDDIPGESTFRGHEREIDVTSWNWGFSIDSDSPPTPHPPAGRAKIAAFTFTHRVDLATPNLMKACLQQKKIRNARLNVRANANALFEYFTLSFEDVVIICSELASPEDSFRTIETVAFTFVKVTEEYTQIKHDGTAGTKVSFSYTTTPRQP